MSQETKKDKKPPYLLGLLCLIPLVGAFIGIALILYGVFKYKDKWLIILGVAGVFFTISVYLLLFHNLKYGKETAKGFAAISQTELNGLVKNIEFYKIEKGSYPDSLEQLRNNDNTIFIDDPLLTRLMDNNIKTSFEYKKFNNKYTLFSVGIDGIAHTIDDIYPVISDTSKFGLIKKM